MTTVDVETEKSPGAPSMLDSIAEHEIQLLGQIEKARQEARKTVARAHDKARAIRDAARASLAAEIAVMQEEARTAREAVRTALLEEAQTRLDELRAGADQRAQAVVDDVIALILPARVPGDP
ncbi:MAG: hypothetical protein KJ052_00845 [Candidatus Hydrogenedentes bacterium]|nr:hypothetical protein [Candidatus Hydrogenedentota bacterium]